MPGRHQRWALLLLLTLSLGALPAAAEAQTCSGYVGITFDDGPSGSTGALLNALRSAGLTPVTFFNIGQNVASNPGAIAQQSALGSVQNHSYTHGHMTSMSQADMQSELSRTNQVISSNGGGTPRIFRPPYGETNSTLQSVASGLGLRVVTWDIDSGDWNNASTSAIVSAAGRLTNGQVILMHEWPANTVAAIPQIAAGLRSRGLCPGVIDPNTGRAVAPGGGTTYALSVTKSGTGTGTVAGGPINCGSTCSANVASGTAVTLTATPASGSTFGGWGGSCTGTGSCIVTMTAARSVSATFNISGGTTYALSVTKSGTGTGTVAGGPINCGSTCSANVASGTAVTLTATPASGSTFGGWGGSCTGTGSCIVTMTAARSVTAAFTAISGGPVSVNAGGAAAGAFLADAYYSGGSTYSNTRTIDTSLLSGTVPPQAVFQTERYGEFTYTIPTSTSPGSAYAVTLYFAETYWSAAGQRTFNVAINGTAVLTAFDIFAAAGGINKAVARTFNATSNANGQLVIQFTKGGGPDNPKICGIAVALGTPSNDFTLTVSKTGNGTGTVSGPSISCGATCSASYASGTTVTLTAAASGGSMFGGWNGACLGTSPTCSVTMTAAQAVTASFTAPVNDIALSVTKTGTGSGTVTASAGGINCGTACSAIYASGTSVTLTASPASGSTFAGWSGACAGTAATCVVSMTTSQAVTATFNTSGGDPGTCKAISGGQSGNFNTTGAICFTVSTNVNGWGCSNATGRTVTVNGTGVTCGQMPLPGSSPYTFSFSAGTYPWASFYWW